MFWKKLFWRSFSVYLSRTLPDLDRTFFTRTFFTYSCVCAYRLFSKYHHACAYAPFVHVHECMYQEMKLIWPTVVEESSSKDDDVVLVICVGGANTVVPDIAASRLPRNDVLLIISKLTRSIFFGMNGMTRHFGSQSWSSAARKNEAETSQGKYSSNCRSD